MGMDSQMLVNSVETLAGFTGGKSARLVGTGELALKSLTDGLTGYYRLGVRPADEDLNGKTRRISVKLTRQGAQLKGYRRYMAGRRPAAETPAVDPTTALRNALRSPVAATGLDLRATAYVMHGLEEGTVRVVVAGDVARAVVGPATAVTALYNDGKPVSSGETALEIEDPQARRELQTALAVKPGTYTLRVAVRDNDGHIGMVERTVDARWVKAGAAQTTGLVLFRHRPGYRAPIPLLESLTTDEQLVAQLTLDAPDPSKASVSIEVLQEGGTQPLLKMRPRVGRSTTGAMLAQQVAPMALLPPGRYTLSATVDASGAATFTRSFAVEAEAPAEPSADTASADLEEGATPPPPRPAPPTLTAILSMARPSRFASTSVLDPAFVAPIIDRLAARPDTAAVREALTEMKIGPWPADAAKGALAASPLAASFVAGLGRLQSGDLEGAANDFRSALRAAPDFAPAMVYLGACYAAGSKDKEAASAWQTSLLRERDAPGVAALAIDAWLRAERNAAALALIKQARTRWPADQTFVRQQAQALLADGKTREGLEVVATLAEPGESILFVSLATLYYDLRAKKTVWDAARDRQTMRELRDAYAKIDGASLALIEAWVAEVTARQ
jgi:hypothetical protein